MNCRFCDSALEFEPAKNHFPNLLSCPCCEWFYQWHRDGLGGNPTREQVEAVLARSSDQEWLDLSNRKMFIWDGSTEKTHS